MQPANERELVFDAGFNLFDAGFNPTLAVLVAAAGGGSWVPMHQNGLTALGTAMDDARNLLGAGVSELARRIAPSVPLDAEAAALLLSALAIWWWAERDTANW